MTLAIEEICKGKSAIDHPLGDFLATPVGRRRKNPLATSPSKSEMLMPADAATGHTQVDARCTPARRRKNPSAVFPAPTSDPMSADSNDEKSTHNAFPNKGLPSPADVAEEVADQANCQIPPTEELPDPATISTIRELQSQRIATVKMQMRIDNQCRALIRRAMGWRMDLPEKEREKLNKSSGELVKAIQKSEAIDPEYAVVADKLRSFIVASRESRRPFDAHRKNVEKAMEKSAASLPVWPWVESIRGFGALGLAIIVGESGDLSNYSNPGKLWKRLGLAVIEGKSQRKSIDVAQAAIQGYNPRRRSAMWTITDALLKSAGPYRDLYQQRRLYEVQQHPEFDKGIDPKTGKQRVTIHCHRRATRYAEKRLVRNLWRAWRDAGQANHGGIEQLV